MNNEQIAKTCHEVNKVYCEGIGDFSQKPWKEAPDWQKKSVKNGVKFHLENPTAGPEHSHKSWLREKEQEGWIYGAVKNVELKTHPCFVPYDQLPTEQKIKDFLFIAVIKSFL